MECLKLALQIGSWQMANPHGCSVLAADCWGGEGTWGVFLLYLVSCVRVELGAVMLETSEM